MGYWQEARYWVINLIPAALWLCSYLSAAWIRSTTRPSVSVFALPRADNLLIGGLPHRWLGDNPIAAFDLFAAGPYMFHAALPVIFLPWLAINESRENMASFCRAFGWMNLVSVATQISLPTAPPWFHDAYVRATNPQLPSYEQKGHPAGLLRVDTILGTRIFQNAYSQSPVVYGAFPSMHCGWPFILALFYTGRYKSLVYAYAILLAWAAMYLKHHYLTDVLGGWAYAYLATKIAKWGECSKNANSSASPSNKTPDEGHSIGLKIDNEKRAHRRSPSIELTTNFHNL